MILLIDNYDSFSYNLYQLVGNIRPDIQVVRNDEVTVEEILERNPQLIILSPGPGRPEQAGICIETVKRLGGKIPIFGVCLGHQAICRAYGGAITYAKKLMHGKTSQILTDPASLLFRGLGPELTVGRYHSLAGTRPRGKTEEEDRMLEEELLADEKELAEHNMLVDLGRNDIGRVSRIGTVKVEKYLNIARYSHVMHIGSAVSGQIREDKDALDVLDAVLPAGTLSGAPKIRACQIISQLEGDCRGLYGGAVGYLDFSGNMDVCIAIRLAYAKDGKVIVRSGAGIVADSVPEKEYQECLNKARAVLNAIEAAGKGVDL